MARPRNKPIDYAVYLAVRLFETFVHMASWETNYRTARVLGRLLYHFDRRHRAIALRHLRLSFPNWPERRVRQTARASMEQMVMLLVDVLLTPRRIHATGWRRHIELEDQPVHLRLLTRRPSPIVYVTGHFGNWEIVGYAVAVLGFPGYAVARPLDNPYLNEHLMGVRRRSGMSILTKKGAAEQMGELLGRKEYVGFIADQDAGRRGLFVNFFGRKASTFKAPALVAMRCDAPVVIAYGRRLERDGRFAIGVQRIIRPDEWADRDDPLRWLTQEYTAALEQAIRSAPEQYLWVHRRWKHRPTGEPDPSDGVA